MLSLRRVAATLALAALASAQTPYNITVTDMSPTVAYTPQQQALAADGWNGTYSETPWEYYTNMSLGEGNTLHTTSMVGASAEVSFVGVGVAFYGSGSGQLVLSVDGEGQDVTFDAGQPGSPVQLLASTSVLFGYHNASIKLVSGSVSLARVVMTTYIGADGAKTLIKNVTALVNESYAEVDLTQSGPWQANERFCGYNDTNVKCVTWNSIGTDTPGASVSVSTPLNTSIMLILGDVGVDYSQYTVTLDPAPPFLPSRDVTRDAKQEWLDYGQILYYAMLDPTLRYKMVLQHAGPNGQVFELGRGVFVTLMGGQPWSPTEAFGSGSGGNNSSNSDNGTNTGAKAKSTPIGAIVGGAVGGAAVLAIIAGLIWFCCRRRKTDPPSGEKPDVHGAKRSLFGRRNVHSEFEIDPQLDVLDQTGQPAHAGNYAVLPSMSNKDLRPPEEQVTPLPLPALPRHHVPLSTGTKSSMLNSPITSSGYQSYPSSPMESGPQSTAGSAFGHAHAAGPPSPMTPHSNAPSSFGGGTFGVGPSSVTSEATTPTSATSGSKAVFQRPRPLPGTPSVTQAEDAGRVPSAPAAPAEEVVPPRYNPDWARE